MSAETKRFIAINLVLLMVAVIHWEFALDEKARQGLLKILLSSESRDSLVVAVVLASVIGIPLGIVETWKKRRERVDDDQLSLPFRD